MRLIHVLLLLSSVSIAFVKAQDDGTAGDDNNSTNNLVPTTDLNAPFPTTEVSTQQVPGTIGGLNSAPFPFLGNFGIDKTFCATDPDFYTRNFGSNLACLPEFAVPGFPEIPAVETCSFVPAQCRLEPGIAFYQVSCNCLNVTGWTCAFQPHPCEPVPIETDCPPADRDYLVETGDSCDFSALDDPDKTCRVNPIACRDAQFDDLITYSRICKCEEGFFNCTSPADDVRCLRGSQFNALPGPKCTRAIRSTGGNPQQCELDMEYQTCRYAPGDCGPDDDTSPRFTEHCECRKQSLFCETIPICGEPTDPPTDPPTFSPTLPPAVNQAAPNQGLCFPEDATVRVKDESVVTNKMMKDLRIGDLVQVDTDGKFEPIYSFGHRNANKKATFVDINKGSLRLSGDHLIWKENSASYVAANELIVGDVLRLAANKKMVVESIRQVVVKGVYAPFTPSGTLIVNDVATSCYANVLSDRMMSGNTFHWMAHYFQFPHRVACHYLGNSCPGETYTEDGISTWMARPYELVQEWSNTSGFFLMGLAAMVVLSVFAVAEYCLLKNPAITLGLVVAMMVLRRRQTLTFKLKSV